jgi:GntR family transcriptional regulator/MocR family aminotransferase
MAIPEESFLLDPGGEGTLQRRIQQMIAEGILSGRLRPGEKMPSTRALARHLGVSRITVTLAYTELHADEYLTARARSGYFVAQGAGRPQPGPQPRPDARNTVDWDGAIVRRLARVSGPEKPANWRSFRYPFIYGQVDATLFDRQSWRLCMLQAMGEKDFASLTDDQFGRDDPQLVEFITRHTLPRRGIIARHEEVLVTLGAQNALWLAAQVLLGPGRKAAIEEPCYPGLAAVLAHTGAEVVRADVNADGIVLESLPRDAHVVFTTPSHQAPTGATMPAARRIELLAAAARRGFVIVEDDYEFEMAYLRPPLPALKSLPGGERVIYVGSFSKSLFPGLRLGYLVGDGAFIREARALRASVLRHPPGLVQRTAAYFLSRGHFDARIRRLSRAYHQRYDAMRAAIGAQGLHVAGAGASGGSSLWMAAPPDVDTEKLAETLRADEVLIEPGRPFFNAPDAPRHFYRLGFSSIAPERIPEGISRIARRIAQLA